MSSKNIFLSLSVATAIFSNLQAQTVNLQKGQNLISFNEEYSKGGNIPLADLGSNIEAITSFGYVSNSFTGESTLQPLSVSELEPGQAYWIKSSKEENVTVDTNGVSVEKTLSAGWNFVGFANEDSLVNVSSEKEKDGYKMDSVASFGYVLNLFDDTLSLQPETVSEFEQGKGYWVKIQKVQDKVTTTDGYEVQLFADSEGKDLSTVSSLIETKTVAEVADMTSSELDGVANIVVSFSKDGLTLTSSYLDPSSDFKSTLETVVSNDLDVDKAKDSFATAGTSLYVYEIEGTGTPKILNDVSVYKASLTTVDGETTYEKGDLLGETSPTGFLYVSDVSTDTANPTIVLVEKDGYFSATQILKAVEGTANYLYVAKDTATAFGGREVAPDGLSRTLDASRPGAWRIDMSGEQTGIILYSANTYLTSNEDLEVLGRPNLKTLNNAQEIEDILNETGYVSELLGSFQAYARDKYKRALFSKSFTDLTNRENSDFKLFLGLTLSEDVLATLYEDKDAFFEDLQLFTYKNGSWTKLETTSTNVKVYTKEDYDNENYEIDVTSRYHQKYVKKFFTGGGNGDENAFLIVEGDLYNGPAPIVAMYKKPVDTKINTNYVTYNVGINVLSHEGNLLPKASVTLVRGNALTEITKPVDVSNSTASFQVLATKTSLEDFTVKVIEGEHYPVVKNLSISDLTPIPEDGNSSNTTFEIKMKAPPEYAVVKGLITANNTYGLQNAEVELLYPLSMAEVDQSARKVINNKSEKGVQVSAVPNAKYKWYIKKATNAEETTNARTLSRVSEDRWTLVQSSSASDGGNFLPYSKIVSQAIVSRENGDEADLEVVVSGKFQVALQVEHDIDADGQVDFTELATTSAKSPNTDAEDFSTTVDEDYGVEVGYISTMVDVDALAQEGLKTVDTEKADYFLREGQTDYSKFETLISYDTGAYDFTSSDTNPTDMFSIDTFNDTYAFLELDSNALSAKFTSRFTIQDDKLKNPSGYQGGYLKLVNTTDGNNDVKNIEWRAVISVYIAETDMLYRLNEDSSGNFNWVADEDYKFDDDEWQNDLSKSLLLKSSDSQFIYSRELGKYISQEQIISRLAETIGTMLTTAGDTETVSSMTQDRQDSLVFGDGFDIDVYAVVKTEVKDPASSYNGQELTLATDIKLPFKDGLDIKKFLKLDKVSFTPPTFLDPSQTTVTDRVGLYEFPVVPLQYGEMNENLSLLRVEASKLGYYDSPVANVPMFIEDNVTTPNREDIKRVNLNIVEKPTYSVKVNTFDRGTGSTLEALVEIDGVRVEQNILESESTETQFGNSVTFNNVIGGKGAERIVRISVPDSDNYMPVVKTMQLKSNEELNVSLLSSTDKPDTTARLTVDNFFVDYERGSVNISLTAFDKTDETLTEASELHLFLNGSKVKNPDVTHATGSTEFTINLPLKIGENEVGIQIANLKGFSDKYILQTSYDPTVGSVNGKVHDFTGAGQLVLDIYTEDNQYYDTVTLPDSGEYLFQDLKAGDVFKLQAVEFDENGEVIQISDFKSVKVPVATTFTQDLQLSEIERTTGFEGGDPVFNFIGNDENTTFSVDENGKATFSATVSNFDGENDWSSIWFFVNDEAVEVNKSALQNAGSDFYYTIQDYEVQLDLGTNVVYGAAINPDSSFDWTKDFYVSWTPDAANLFSITGTVNGQGEALGYSFISLYDYNDFSFVGTTEADENGTFEFSDLLNGQYAIYIDGGVEYEDFAKLYTVSDSNILNVEINLTEYVETIEIPDFYVDLVTQDTATAGDTIYLNANLNSLDGAISQSDFTFEWKVNDSVVTPTNTTAHQEVAPNDGTSYMDFEITVTHTTSGEISTASKTVYVEPARINSRPDIDGFAVISSDEKNDTNTDFVFDVNASDYENDSLSYTWFIDGNKKLETSDVVTYNFSTTGEYNVSVQVSDGEKMAEESLLVNVSDIDSTLYRDVLEIENSEITIGSDNFAEKKTLSNGTIEGVSFNSTDELSYEDILKFAFELSTPTGDDEFEVGKTENIVLGIKVSDSERAILTILEDVEVERTDSGVSMEVVSSSNLFTLSIKADGSELSTNSTVLNPSDLLTTINGVVEIDFANILNEVANGINLNTETINNSFGKDGSYKVEFYFSGLDGLSESSEISASDIGDNFTSSYSSMAENKFSGTILGFGGEVTVTGNSAPVIDSVEISSSDENNDTYSNFAFDVYASDDDGDSLSYSWSVNDSVENETSSSFIKNFASEGTYTVNVEVSDGELSDSVQIDIEVENGTVIPTPPSTPTL